MAIFDQIGKKLTDVGQSVTLNSAIADKKKAISQLFSALGEAYYEQHKYDPNAEQLPMITQINELFAEIDQHGEEIKQLKGITKCPACGSDVAANAVFCNTCGTRMPKPELVTAQQTLAPGMKRCPNCGAVLPEANRFCNRCGMKLDEAAE